MKEVPIETIDEILEYRMDSGELFWKFREFKWFKSIRDFNRWNNRYAGKRAFNTSDGLGYKIGCIFGKNYKAHRVIWCMHYGRWPSKFIDHINGCRSDNRIENLREATHSENERNKGIQSNNKSGYKGVHFDRTMGKWRAQIRDGGKPIRLGWFDCPEEASKAYKEASNKLHKEFSRY